MKGFKDSTKTQYSMGGSCYAKGGAVKGAAKVSKVMGEFKSGALHSGSKKGPEVTNPKQAVAIALSEARKAGAKIPMKKAEGGHVKKSEGGYMGGPTVDESSEERAPNLSANAARDAADFRRRKGLEVTKTTVREVPADSVLSKRLSRPVSAADMARAVKAKPTYRDIPLIGGALGTMRDAFKEATGLKKGGLAVMPKGKGKC